MAGWAASAASFFIMRTVAYIDGFNLYYGALKNTSYKWLDIQKLLELSLKPTQQHHPQRSIIEIKYFTAHVSSLPENPNAPARQGLYLRALKTLPKVKIYKGHFLTHERFSPLASSSTQSRRIEPIIEDRANGKLMNLIDQLEKLLIKTEKLARLKVKTLKSEEKGSDVNLASHLLLDAFENKYDSAIIVSNDSDLFTPIKLAKNQFNKRIGVISPYKRPSAKLSEIANFMRKGIKKIYLEKSQFPETLSDQKGSFHKPSEW